MKFLSLEEIREVSKRSATRVFGIQGSVYPYTSQSDLQENTSDQSTVCEPRRAEPGMDIVSDPGETRLFSATLPRSAENLLCIIQAMITSPMRYLYRDEAARLAGVTGGATILNAERWGLESDVIRKHELPKAKTQKCLWEVLPKGLELCKLPVPEAASKGSYVHGFCANRLAWQSSQRGFKAVIEYRRRNEKSVDLWVDESGRVVFIEICASFPVSKELDNLKADYSGEDPPDEIVFAVTNRKMRDPLRRLVHEFLSEHPSCCPVRVELAGDLIESLEVAK